VGIIDLLRNADDAHLLCEYFFLRKSTIAKVMVVNASILPYFSAARLHKAVQSLSVSSSLISISRADTTCTMWRISSFGYGFIRQ